MQICLCHVNVAIDLPGLPQIPAPVTDQSCAATSSGQVAQGKIERTIPFRISADETLDIGEDTGTPVSEDYQVPFKFSGDLKKVAIQLSDAVLTAEEEAEIRRIRAEIGMSR